MIKIRLHGEKEEIELACAAIKEHFDVLNVSHLYADRGDSVYKRAYIDAKLKPSIPVIKEEKMKERKLCDRFICENSVKMDGSCISDGKCSDCTIKQRCEKCLFFFECEFFRENDEEFLNLMIEFDEMGYCPTTFTDSPEADAKKFKDRLIEIYNRR